MGKLNEIQKQMTQSYGDNAFTTTIKDDTVEFDSLKDKFTFADEVEVPSLKVNGESVSSQVQSDWNQNDSEAADYIKNKPEIPTPEPQVQADWNQNDSSAVDYVKNRPFYQIGEASLIGEVVASTSMMSFILSTALINDKTYTVNINGTDYSVTSTIGAGGLVTLNSPYGNIFYDPNHTVAQTPNNAFVASAGNGDTIKIYNYVDIVKLNSKFLDGVLIKRGSSAGSNIFNNSYNNNSATGENSSSFGSGTTASGYCSTSFGDGTTASEYCSASFGVGTTSTKPGQFVFGTYNISDTSSGAIGKYAEIVGNGSNASNKSNARTLDWTGNEVLSGTLTIGGASGATIKVDSGALKVSFDGGTTWLTISAS